jgi:hypothetical protein
MTAEQAVNHPSRNVISRALGAEETVQIDLKTSIVHPSTTFLLCSDGITRHIEDWEIAALLSSDGEPAEICRRMKDVCYDRGAEDNLTAVIVRFPGEKTSSKTNGNLITGLETEQLTIAAARPPFDKVIGGDDTILDSSEIETQDLTNRAAVHSKKEDLGFLLADDSDFFVEEPEKDDPAPYTSSSIVVPAHAETVEEHLPVYSEPADEAGEPEGREDFIKKVLSAAALLIVGGMIGFGTYYFLLQPPPVLAPEPPPALTEMKSNNTALTAFEEGRRQVDSDPAKYIMANAASPQEAEDYFLLARAFLLTGKYWDAKRFYGLAKDRLGQVEESNAKTLAAEIAMALAIIDSPSATENFSKQIATISPNTNSDTNINANVPDNGSQTAR